MKTRVWILKSLIIVLLIGGVLSCTSIPLPPRDLPRPAASTATTPAPAPAPTPAPAPEPEPELTPDYIAAGHGLVGYHFYPEEMTLYDIPFVVSDIRWVDGLDGWHIATPLIPVPGYEGEEEEIWSPYVFGRTLIATVENLEIEQFVFVAFDTDPREEADLAVNGVWRYAKVSDLSRVEEGIVGVEFLLSSSPEWQTKEYHIQNIRLANYPFFHLELRGLGGPPEI